MKYLPRLPTAGWLRRQLGGRKFTAGRLAIRARTARNISKEFINLWPELTPSRENRKPKSIDNSKLNPLCLLPKESKRLERATARTNSPEHVSKYRTEAQNLLNVRYQVALDLSRLGSFVRQAVVYITSAQPKK